MKYPLSNLFRGILSAIVRLYILRFRQELRQIYTDTIRLQQKQLKLVLNSPLVKYYHGDVTGQKFHQMAPTRHDSYELKTKELQRSESHLTGFYAQSSGTTSGTKKWIPTPLKFLRMNHIRGTWYVLYILQSAGIAVFKGISVLVGGLIYSDGKKTKIADVSALMIDRIPYLFKWFYIPDLKIAVRGSWKEKFDHIVHNGLQNRKIKIISGVPTWILSIIRDILRKSNGASMKQLWPEFACYIHGGVDFSIYKSEFENLFRGMNIRFLEIYNATEGFFALQDDLENDGMLLLTNNHIYFEFIPYEEFKLSKWNIIDLGKVRIHVDYVMLISTTTGLLRYIQGDTVRFTSIDPYRIKVSGRIQEYINAFGEDLNLQQTNCAITQACQMNSAELAHYTVAPKPLSIEEKGWHEWYVEFEVPPIDEVKFRQDLDRELRNVNFNYDQKRTEDFALESLRMVVLPKGFFEFYMWEKNKMGGQNKLQRLRNDRELADSIMHLLKTYHATSTHP